MIFNGVKMNTRMQFSMAIGAFIILQLFAGSAWGYSINVGSSNTAIVGQSTAASVSLPDPSAYTFSSASFLVNNNIYSFNSGDLSGNVLALFPPGISFNASKCMAAYDSNPSAFSCNVIFENSGSYSGNIIFTNDSDPTNALADVTVPISFAVNPKLVLYVNSNVLNDPDSGDQGNWAIDNFTRTIKVWQIGPTSFTAVYNDTGTSSIIAGAPSPKNGVIQPANGTATMVGNTNITFTATGFNSSYDSSLIANNSIGTLNMKETPADLLANRFNASAPTQSTLNYYLNQYFTGVSSINVPTGGWTYVYKGPVGGTQSWTDAVSTNWGTTNTNDIVTNKLVLYVNSNVLNDPDSGDQGNWAIDNFTRTIKVWQIGPTSFTAVYNDTGTSSIIAGAPSPKNGVIQPANGTATMVGNTNITFTATGFNSSYDSSLIANNSIGTLNMKETPADLLANRFNASAPTQSTLNYYLNQYFTGVSSINVPTGGWTYVYKGPVGGTQSWTDAVSTNWGTTNTNDIVTNKLVINVSQSITNDADSGEHGAWAYDNFTQYVKVYQTAPSTFTAMVYDNGTWHTFAGAKSPDYGVTQPSNGTGRMFGGYNATSFTGTLLATPTYPTTGNIGTFKYNETPSDVVSGTTAKSGAQTDWLNYYFSSDTGFNIGSTDQPAGWTYNYNLSSAPSERWFDNGTNNLWGAGTGDIVTYPTIKGDSGNVVVNNPGNANSIVYLAGANALLVIYSSNAMPVNVMIENVTSNFTGKGTPSSGSLSFSPVSIQNLTLTNASGVTYTLTISIPCGSNAAPYKYNTTTNIWMPLQILRSTSCAITFVIPPDPVVGIFTNVQNSLASNGGSSGGSVGAGAGGSITPSVSTNGSCQVITNLYPPVFANVTVDGTKYKVVSNFITPTNAGVSVNGVSYTLNVSSPQTVVTLSNDTSVYVELDNINYAPSGHLVQVSICSQAQNAPTTTAQTTTVATTLPTTTVRTTTVHTTVPSKNATTNNSSTGQNSGLSAPPSSLSTASIAILLAIAMGVAYYGYSRNRQRKR